MAKISKMIDDLTGKTEEEQRIKEQFSFLQKMARAKSEVFENELKLMLASGSTGSPLEIVGDKAFEYHHGEHINISNGCDEAIMGAVNEFFKGKAGVKEGFKTLVKHGLSGIIGDTTIGETEDKMFFVFPENYSIVRVDVKAYKYTFSNKNIFAKEVDNVFVYSMCKSIVDHSKVGVDYLMHAVVDMMRTEEDKDPDLTAVMDFIKELIMCWNLLDSVQANRLPMFQASQSGPVATPMAMSFAKEQIEAVRPSVESRVEEVTPEQVMQLAASYEKSN